METPSSGTATPVDLEEGDGQIRKRLTVTFRGLNVQVTALDAAVGGTLWSEMDPRQIKGLLKRSNGPKRVGDSIESSTTQNYTRYLLFL